MAPYGLPIISLCLALLAVALRRVRGLRYWMVALCVIVLSLGVMHWFPEAQKVLWIFVFAFPMSAAFATANAGALRARPLLVMVVVPLVFLATVLADLIIGVNLGILRP